MNPNEPEIQTKTQRRSPRRRKRTTARQTAKPRANLLPSAFSKVSDQIWELNDVKSYTIKTAEDILQQRGVPREHVCPPSLEIAIPAIEAMRYSPLRREIVGLIATTMDRQNAHIAHPSFLTILQQLTEDEVRVLSAFPSTGRVLPMAHLWLNLNGDRAQILHRNIVPAAIAAQCQWKSRLPLYIDNLLRLKLLQEPEGAKIGDARLYSDLLHQPFCRETLQRPQVRRKSTLEKHVIALSSIGETFKRVCLSYAAG